MRWTIYFAALASAMCFAGVTEAPIGLYNQSNGFTSQATFDADRATFEQTEEPEEGLGPLYNAQSCRECHQTPTTGGASQVTELRVGHRTADGSFESPSIAIAHGAETIRDRTLVNDRATCPNADFKAMEIQERVPETETIRALRLSLPLFGDGFIEAIPDQAIIDNAQSQCTAKKGVCGVAMKVPILESNGTNAVGRFGWKAQHASLLSFSADAYFNEMGITNRLFPDELTYLCNTARQPNDVDADIEKFARFMRALEAPNRDAIRANSPQGHQGAKLFAELGCNTCHVETFSTAPAGTMLHGGAYTVTAAIGDKMIHPYSDFLLHDVGTGDGIEIIAAEHFGKRFRGRNSVGLANYLRTPALWGLRLRSRLMHDGLSVTFTDAIKRHRNEGQRAANAFNALSESDREALFEFLTFVVTLLLQYLYGAHHMH